MSERNKRRLLRDGDRIRALTRRWWRANPDRAKKYLKKYYDSLPAQKKADLLDKANARSKARYLRNKFDRLEEDVMFAFLFGTMAKSSAAAKKEGLTDVND